MVTTFEQSFGVLLRVLLFKAMRKHEKAVRRGPVVAPGRGRPAADMTLLSDTFLLPSGPPERMTAEDISEIARLCALVLAMLLLVVGNFPTATESTAWRTPPPQDADVSVIWDMDSSELLDDMAAERHTWELQDHSIDWLVVENDDGEEDFTITEVPLVRGGKPLTRQALRGLRFPGSLGLQSIVSVEVRPAT